MRQGPAGHGFLLPFPLLAPFPPVPPLGLCLLARRGAQPVPGPEFPPPLPVYKEEADIWLKFPVSSPKLLTLLSLTCRQTFSFMGNHVLMFND